MLDDDTEGVLKLLVLPLILLSSVVVPNSTSVMLEVLPAGYGVELNVLDDDFAGVLSPLVLAPMLPSVAVVSTPAADSVDAASGAFVDSFVCARRWRCPANSRPRGGGRISALAVVQRTHWTSTAAIAAARSITVPLLVSSARPNCPVLPGSFRLRRPCTSIVSLVVAGALCLKEEEEAVEEEEDPHSGTSSVRPLMVTFSNGKSS